MGSRSFRLLFAAALLAMSGSAAGLSYAYAYASAPIDGRIFAGRAPGERASFLVVLRAEADLAGAAAIADRTERIRFVHDALAAQAEVSQASLRARLDELQAPYRAFFVVDMVEVEGTRELAEELARRPEVASIAANPRVRMEPEPLPRGRDPRILSPFGERAAATIEENISKIGAPAVWSSGFTGQGIVVASADTGVQWNHPALVQQYRGSPGPVHDYNWHDAIHDPGPGNVCGSDAAAPCDDSGHGTGTTGVAVGDDGVGNQVGVAPGARWIACRNMDRGVGTPARYAECFQWFLSPTDHNGQNPRPDLAPHVINNSWGCPPDEGCTDPNVLKAVIDHVSASGIFVVFSAGNSGPTCGTTTDVPVFYASVVTVGATDMSDGIASFSSRGPATFDGSGRLKPEISAPGVGIRTAASNGQFQTFSGTSAASPHVAGAVALLWSAVPSLTGNVAGTLSLLEQTAVHLTIGQDCGTFPGASVPNAVFGWGRLAIDVAVAVALPPPPPRAAPAPPPRRRPVPRFVGR
jgi:subtilisin family serine protease